jgi:colanic acid/amylovoran biosynthesis glycosyltransferase
MTFAMRKKIGFVLNAPLRYSETFLLQEFKLLKDAGFEVIIFEGYGEEKVSYNYKRIKSLPLIKIEGWKSVLHISITLMCLFTLGLPSMIRFIILEAHSGTGILRIFKRIWFNAHILPLKVDYLHFCFAEVAIQKEFTAKAISAKMSVSLRGSDIAIYPKENKDCYKRLWEQAEKIHAVSQWIYDQAIQLGLERKKKYVIIHDCVDLNRINFNDSDIHSPLRILSVGRLEPVKDHEFALKIIRELLDHNIKLQYSIIGEGSLHYFLLSSIKKLGLEECVQLRGRQGHEITLQLMTSADIYIHTSKSEGLGVSLLEAQAAGLLTIAQAAGGTEESIEDNLSGWIIGERDPSAMAKRIMEIIQLPSSERIRVKTYARKRIEEKFNIQQYLSLWKEFYEN